MLFFVSSLKKLDWDSFVKKIISPFVSWRFRQPEVKLLGYMLRRENKKKIRQRGFFKSLQIKRLFLHSELELLLKSLRNVLVEIEGIRRIFRRIYLFLIKSRGSCFRRHWAGRF